MNFSQLGKIQELKGHMDTFRRNHPKFPMFLGAVAQNAVEEGTIIEINVTAPNGDSLRDKSEASCRRSGIYPCTAGDGKIKNIRKFKKVLAYLKRV